MKKIISLLLAILTCVSLFGCATTGNNENEITTNISDGSGEVEGTEAPAEKEYPEIDYGLDNFVDFTPVSQDDRIMEGTYVKVSDIDKKYVQTETNGMRYLFYSTPQFELAGIKDPAENNGEFYRLDAHNKDKYNQLNQKSIKTSLATNTSGVTLRFRTNADKMMIYATKQNATSGAQHFSEYGANGFDVYVGTGTDRVYCADEGQVFSGAGVTKQTVKLPDGYKEVLINFPTYAGIQSFLLALPAEAEIAEPLERAMKPIVFYGSSITQGACTARPGTAYFNVVTRMLNADCINQGYSSGAHLEQVMAQHIASLDGIGAVVIDNGGNGTLETLQSKHYSFYKTIRNAHPDIPIILVSRPIYKVEKDADDEARIKAMQNTYNKAVKAGDKNIYFVSGYEFTELRALADLTTVDGTHPNDFGMYSMACRIYEELVKAFANQTKQ